LQVDAILPTLHAGLTKGRLYDGKYGAAYAPAFREPGLEKAWAERKMRRGRAARTGLALMSFGEITK
jgi:hypothetical protein